MIGIGATMAGTALTAWGANIAGQGGSKNVQKGAMMSAGGNALSGAGMGLMMGGIWGAVAGGFLGLLTSITGLIDAFDKAKVLEEDRRKAQEEYDEANLKRAESKENYNKLNNYIVKLRQLETTRFDSQENYDEWVELNAEVLEAFPQLTSSFDEANNAIVNLTNAEE